MLMLKLLLAAGSLCLSGQPPVKCGDDGAKRSCTCRVVATVGDKAPACCGVSVGHSGKQMVVFTDGKNQAHSRGFRVHQGDGGVWVVSPDGAKSADSDGTAKVKVFMAPSGTPQIRWQVEHADDEQGDESMADRIRAPKSDGVWIGVRMGPIPSALAAHIGESGLMVANVAKGSPADEAGLRQYDIITGFDDKEINSTEDLVSAIAANGKSRTGITVIRGGKEKSLRIKPAQRPDMDDLEFKYDEPQDAVVDDNVQFRGKMLLPGQNGVWRLKDLGGLKGLPEALKSLKNQKGFKFDIDMDDFDIDMNDLKGAHKFGAGTPHVFQFGNGDFHGKFELKFTTDQDGDTETIEIEQDDDGSVVLKKIDEDGNVTTKTFDSLKELQENSSDAAKLFGHGRMFIGGGPGGNAFQFKLPGNMKNLPKLRKQWQKQIEKTLEDVEKQLEGAKVRIRRFHDAGGDDNEHEDIDAHSTSKSVSISVSNGKVSIVINEDGNVKKYKYDSIADLKKDNPDLWNELKDQLGDDDD